MSALVLLVAVAVAGLLAFAPPLRRSSWWKATVTPLASIMGSGFLVSAPLVAGVVGLWAPLAMAALLAGTFAIGAMLRFNIRHAEADVEEAHQSEHRLHRGHHLQARNRLVSGPLRIAGACERLSHVVLAGAYVVSVSYYLQLLATFVLDRVGIHDLWATRAFTTAVLLVITAIGAARGLKALEQVETYAVSLNLGLVAALLVGLAVHDAGLALGGQLALPELAPERDRYHAARVLMGLLIVVQGFETSRFLGAEHPADERVRTMRAAQLIAAAIYVVFVTLMLPLLGQGGGAEVTAIVGLVAPVATLLPTAIVVAAVGSQFSASVADDAGCAGLVGSIVGDRLSPRWTYLAIGSAAVALTWLTDVFAVISIASRAFAAFYALQCAVTAIVAYRKRDVPHRGLYVAGGVATALLAAAVTVFAIPAE